MSCFLLVGHRVGREQEKSLSLDPLVNTLLIFGDLLQNGIEKGRGTSTSTGACAPVF